MQKERGKDKDIGKNKSISKSTKYVYFKFGFVFYFCMVNGPIEQNTPIQGNKKTYMDLLIFAKKKKKNKKRINLKLI